ncbi:putative enzyme of the cupin superfamily [Rubrobacter radiotolerans]|uniref:Cupin domain-containing protein n=1 Tax=Rubrobacter radiotolerans TaxID=42256 RepID=A0A023WZ91_RUBRA|nr:cupin domain-containing protein [Rubrobacter radiotolerans]AHY45413.1 putative enzyme of the cupin superfamily [Rubrobacter radiotolerans]MDX5892824.1 cupin domain-containing protein [Rubrobacter radiotolerans]SMC02563.1 hypothetical protein SAMN00767673_0132 [Rubrobacter radiotolerans DSM 5868]
MSDREAGLRSTAPHLKGVSRLREEGLADWGIVPEAIEGESRASGVLIHKGRGGSPEAGVWVCTPGFWRLCVERDEFCHFLEGRCTYTHESGEVIEIEPDTSAFFPAGWTGTCRVRETVRKAYMIR